MKRFSNKVFTRSLCPLLILLFCMPIYAKDTEYKLFLKLEGIDGALLDNVKAYLPQSPVQLHSATEVRRLQLQEPNKIKQALQALGYYNPSISMQVVRTDPTQGQLTFVIKPGPPVRIAHADITITAEQQQLATIAQQLFPADQRIFHHGDYQAAKSTLLSEAVALGYLDAQYTISRVQINPQQNSADIQLALQLGPRHRFGAVSFSGSDLSLEYLQKFNPIQQGDWYEQSPLLALQNNLERSGYFKNVAVLPEFEQADTDYQIPIQAKLSPKKRFLYRFKVGASTDSEWRLAFDFENRQANRLGHYYQTGFEYSPDKSNAHYQYSIPLKKPLTDTLILSSTWQHLSEEIGTSTQLNLRVARERQRANGWLETVALNYLHESLTAQSTLIESSNDLIIPEFSFQNRRSDDNKYPVDGYHWFYGAKVTDTALGSTELSFVQLDVRGKYIQAIQPKHRLIINTEIGYTFIDENSFIKSMPASLRYLTGGDNTVRGYAYKSLGPKDENGELIGGMHQIITSAEYDYRLYDNWLLAAFYDMGNAFNDYKSMQFKKSIGFGPRWLSPVGPIRMSIAKALDDEKQWRFHLTMGFDL